MDSILQIGINLILFLQSLGEWLLTPMKLFTFMGNEEFYLFIAPWIYWCCDTSLGLRVGMALMVSTALNTALKFAFHHPRPYWYDTRVKAYSTETSFGAPSNHSQSAAVIWGRLAVGIKRKWFWVTAIVIIFLIGVSRMYLGVHFLHDVLLGWLFGALLLWGWLVLEKRLTPRLQKMRPNEQALWAFGASLVLILIGSSIALGVILSGWKIPPIWVNNAMAASPDALPPAPFSLEGLITSAGAFFGLALGAILLSQQGGMDTHGPAWQLALRFLLGLAGVLAIRYGLKAIFPEGEALLPYFLRYVRYTLIGAWISGAAPLIFIRLKLAQRKSGR
jgi:membrane-associated phospholipid phosphatase